MAAAVTVDLKDLAEGKVDKLLPDAFGPDSLGIIIVKGLPEKYHVLRHKVLCSASDLAQLPQEKLAQLESPESHWLVGWSCGKEKLVNGKPDELKGSWYVNCSFHSDPALDGPADIDEKYSDMVTYTAKNVWPAKADLPNFEDDLKELCNLIIDTAQIVARACDRYVGETGMEGYEQGYLERIVKTSTTSKARLLHYFPTKHAAGSSDNEDWCGEHLDHSCLTGLTSAMFLDKQNQVLDSSPDPEAGLYIKNRRGEVVRVAIPKDALAFQTGEALELVTNGQFKAVPHFVKGSTAPGVSRNTLAVFCQPSLHEKVSTELDFAQFSRQIIAKNH